MNIKSENSQQSVLDSTNKIFALLGELNFSQIQPDQLNLNYFDQQLIEKVIESCKTSSTSHAADNNTMSTSSSQLYDIKRLKNILVYEIKQSGLNISRANLTQELKYILENVLERNLFQLSYLARKKFFDAFKLLTESFVLLVPCDVFDLNQRFTFLIELIKILFTMVNFNNNF